jgi:hypothetical protein
VAALFSLNFREVTGYDFEGMVACSMQDGAAKGVSAMLGMEETDQCGKLGAAHCQHYKSSLASQNYKIFFTILFSGMHDTNKVAEAASGSLERKKNKVAINPFPQGVELMGKVHSYHDEQL